MNVALVTTTIHVPTLLAAYAANARRYRHSHVTIIVVGDHKTPSEAAAFCQGVDRTVPCIYLGVSAQEAWLQGYPKLAKHLPYNCIQRRNVGILKAFADGADVIITIDDDNFLTAGDYIGAQALAGSHAELPAFASSSGWFNVCQVLETDADVPLYHRGFPHLERWREAEQFVSCAPLRQRCVVNAGFWLDDPDMGALDRMQRQVTVRGKKREAPERFFLQPGTWSPFNSQNTALSADVIPAYFLSPCVGRYDDIWASYIVCRLAEHLGDAIAFGQPWVRQLRNPHNLWKDLQQEQQGMVLTDGFCRALRDVPLSGRTYAECTRELIDALPSAWSLQEHESETSVRLKDNYLTGLRIWHEATAMAAEARRGAEARLRRATQGLSLGATSEATSLLQ